jgi:G protein beta subunit-like protein
VSFLEIFCLYAFRLLATTSADHTVKVWSVKDFSLVKTLSGHQRWVWDCVFSADSAYLMTGKRVEER